MFCLHYWTSIKCENEWYISGTYRFPSRIHPEISRGLYIWSLQVKANQVQCEYDIKTMI